MEQREKWSQPLTCTQCGAEGNATFSHDASVVMTSRTLAVDDVSGDFRLETLGRTPEETVFKCQKCGTLTPGQLRVL